MTNTLTAEHEHLIDAILKAYHTTRLCDSATKHILSKPYVQEAFAALTNEPVGVTISREHGHKIHEMLKYYFEKHPTDDDEATALVALSAALGSETA